MAKAEAGVLIVNKQIFVRDVCVLLAHSIILSVVAGIAPRLL